MLHGARAYPYEPGLIDVVAAVRRDGDRYWVCRRTDDGAHGGLAGYWEYPGGKVESGEELWQALQREMREEFAVECDVIARLDTIVTEAEGRRYRVHFFAVRFRGPYSLRVHDCEAWMTVSGLLAQQHLPSGTEFNRRLAMTMVGPAPSSPSPEKVPVRTSQMIDSIRESLNAGLPKEERITGDASEPPSSPSPETPWIIVTAPCGCRSPGDAGTRSGYSCPAHRELVVALRRLEEENQRVSRDLTRLREELWAERATKEKKLVDALAQVQALSEALRLAATRLEILTGRMRACHEETGQHELMQEAEMFCGDARAALALSSLSPEPPRKEGT